MTGRQTGRVRKTLGVAFALGTVLVVAFALGTVLVWSMAGLADAGEGGEGDPEKGEPSVVAESTGEVEAALEPVVTLPPGDIMGIVTRPDGETPYANMPVALMDAAGGEAVMNVATAPDGTYVLEDVPAGTYTLQVGEPGLAVSLETEEGADAASLNVMMLELLVAPSVPNAPVGVEPTPAAATAVVNYAYWFITLVAIVRVGAGREGSGQPWPPPPWISPWRP